MLQNKKISYKETKERLPVADNCSTKFVKVWGLSQIRSLALGVVRFNFPFSRTHKEINNVHQQCDNICPHRACQPPEMR